LRRGAAFFEQFAEFGVVGRVNWSCLGAAMGFAGRRILLVEDDFLVALGTSDLLEGAGCEVVGPAPSLAEALHLIRSKSINAAILDVNVAGEMVWPVAEELQRRGVPFLFLSAYPRTSIVPDPFAGILRLEKPFDPNQLLHHLAAICGVPGEPVSA
jgi:DNA-binding response OmpR family regulator